jgi:hypothetical protein
VFTARYALSPYIKQTRFVFKGLMLQILEGSRKTVPLVRLSEGWAIKSNPRQLQTSAGGKSDSPSTFFKNGLTSESLSPFFSLSPNNCISLQ